MLLFYLLRYISLHKYKCDNYITRYTFARKTKRNTLYTGGICFTNRTRLQEQLLDLSRVPALTDSIILITAQHGQSGGTTRSRLDRRDGVIGRGESQVVCRRACINSCDFTIHDRRCGGRDNYGQFARAIYVETRLRAFLFAKSSWKTLAPRRPKSASRPSDTRNNTL